MFEEMKKGKAVYINGNDSRNKLNDRGHGTIVFVSNTTAIAIIQRNEWVVCLYPTLQLVRHRTFFAEGKLLKTIGKYKQFFDEYTGNL